MVDSKSKYRRIAVLNLGQLNRYTIADIADADVITVSSSLFRSNDYLLNLSTLAATKDLPVSDHRYFNACLKSAIAGLHQQVDHLQNKGAEELVKVIEQGLSQDPDDVIELSKRLVGSKYAKLKEQEDMQIVSEESEVEKPKQQMWKDSWKPRLKSNLSRRK